jgi:phosphoribosylformimino-5-aminoimidazole carboxamide ribotide isomerase
MIKLYADRLAVALDAKQGRVATHGWQQTSDQSVVALAEELHVLGVKRLVYTDVSKDGTLTEPNYQVAEQLIEAISAPIIISGGIASINQIKRLKQLGAEAVIVGKALYENKFKLRQALFV